MLRDEVTGRIIPEPVEDRIARNVLRVGKCLIWQASKDRGGYGWLKGVGEKKAHRVALTLKLGRPIKEGFEALHTCDTPSCVEEEHLYEGTQEDNLEDCRRRDRNRLKGAHGTANGMCTHPGSSMGARNAMARVSDTIVVDIRRRAEAETHQKIADSLGINRVTVTNIIDRRTWKHVD